MAFYSLLNNGIRSALVTGVACLLLSTPLYAADYVTVIKDKVNVRTEATTKSSVYMELFKGYPLKVLQTKDEWLKISDYEGDSGWIHNSLVGKNNTVIVNAKKSVNMRSGPDTTKPVIADVERGVIMTKLQEEGKWMKVKHSGGTTGWIYKPLLWP